MNLSPNRFRTGSSKPPCLGMSNPQVGKLLKPMVPFWWSKARVMVPIKSSWFRVYKNIEYSEKVLCENQTMLLRSTMLVLWKNMSFDTQSFGPMTTYIPYKDLHTAPKNWMDIYKNIRVAPQRTKNAGYSHVLSSPPCGYQAKPAVGRSNLQWAFHLYVNVYQRVYINTIWLWLTVSPWKITILIGQSSISMGHLYHGYVSHNQRVDPIISHSWSNIPTNYK